MYKHTSLRGGSESEDINDINLSQIDNLMNIININVIKGGFPRIKICDNEITKKILEKKPREFSHQKIISIKDMLKMKKKSETPYMFFCHTSDKFVLTSTDHIWVHDLNLNLSNKCVIPLLSDFDIRSFKDNFEVIKNVYAICTDYINLSKSIYT